MGDDYMKIGYARVSTKDQNLERQLQKLKEHNIEKIFKDKASGQDFERIEYQNMKTILRRDDILIVTELDRLGRNKQAIKKELEEFKEL